MVTGFRETVGVDKDVGVPIGTTSHSEGTLGEQPAEGSSQSVCGRHGEPASDPAVTKDREPASDIGVTRAFSSYSFLRFIYF